MINSETNVTNIIGRNCIVYSVLGDFSEENKSSITVLQQNISRQFPAIIWETPPSALHITLLVWANSLGGSSNADELFRDVFSRYDEVLKDILKNYHSIEIEFSEIRVTPEAIILVGKDRGEFQEIRDTFIKEVSLPLKQPTIIHATIARFNKPYSLSELDKFLKTKKVHIREYIHRFKLPRETKKPMLEFEVIKYYELENKM